ncbi:hypothetical protein R6Z07F_003964 [Ovis aries]
MVCSAAPVLLLAMTLPLVEPPAARASQPGQRQARGGSGPQLDPENGAGELVLISVYIQLDFTDDPWLAALSQPLTVLAASASSAPVTLTGLNLTTECNVTHNGCSYCACLSGYQWNSSVCSHHQPCQTSIKHRPCGCLVLNPTEVGYCQLLPPDGDTTCPEDSSTVAWNVTRAGHVAQAPCPGDRTGTVKRPCGPDGVWGPIHSNCTDTGLLALLLRAQLLQAGQGWPEEEVSQILAQLQEQVEAVTSPSDLLALVGTMTVLAKVVADTGTQLNCSALEAVLKTTDKVLGMNSSSLWTLALRQMPSVGSSLLLAVETLAHSLCPQDQPFSFVLPNVQLQSQLLEPTFPANYRVSFPTQPPLQAWIPRHSLAPLRHNGTNVSITSLVLQELDHLLPSNYGQGLGDSLYATPGLVLAISIMAGGQVFKEGEVIMDFGDIDGSPHCVFWDHDLFQGKGGWSDAGCQVQAASASPTTQCICRHLTAFSILMSGHTVPNNPTLELLSQMGLGASILALLLCLGVYRLVWRFVVRNKVAYLRHSALLNMVLCLLAANACFLGAPLLPAGPHSPLCLAAAFLCHFLYLATFFWMLAQALMLAHQLLFVFHQLSKLRVLSLMVLLGYLCPMGLAGITLGLYLPRGQYLSKGACWLDKKGGALYTFVGPVLAIVGVNGLVLTMAVLKLLRPSLSEGPQVEKRQALLGVIKALLILTPISGLTWGLGLATLLEEVSIVPHYLFTVLNASQGVFILLFGCLMDKKVQEALRKRFCCSHPPPDPPSPWPQVKPASQKTAKEEVKMPGENEAFLGAVRIACGEAECTKGFPAKL